MLTAGRVEHWHDSPAHGEMRNKMHHIVGGLSLFGADDTHLLVLVVATDITCQPQGHHHPMAVGVSEDHRHKEVGHVLQSTLLQTALWYISTTLQDVTSLRTVMFTCYISCIPLNSAATACVLAGPWLCCHVGNPECRVVLVERIRASVVQRVPVLGRCQPQWELAFAGRGRCNTSTHFFGTSLLPQRSGQSFRRKQHKHTVLAVYGTGCPTFIFARIHINNSYRHLTNETWVTNHGNKTNIHT